MRSSHMGTQDKNKDIYAWHYNNDDNNNNNNNNNNNDNNKGFKIKLWLHQ